MPVHTPIFVDQEDASDIYRFVDAAYTEYQNLAIVCQKSPVWARQYSSVGFITDPGIAQTKIDIYLQSDVHEAMNFLQHQYTNPIFLLGNQRLLTDINPSLTHARLKGSTPAGLEQFAANNPSQLVDKLREYSQKNT
jgi:hypothetical protein